MTLTPPASVSSWPDYLSEADVFLPVGSLVFERSESAPPAARFRTLVGRVNSGALGSYAIGTLLFARLNSQSVDGGRVWRTVYEFRYDPDGWQHEDTYKGTDGKPPADATEQSFTVYESANFSTLGLDFTDSQTPI